MNDLRNITPFDELAIEIDDLYAEARNWADGEPVVSQEQCDALAALDKALHGAGRRMDVLRIEEKRPLDEAVKAIQDRFNPYIQPGKGKVARAREALNPLIVAWRNKVLAEKEAAALKARIEADAELQKAREQMQASAGDLAGREQAEEQLALAKEADAFASRREKGAATGNGLRPIFRPVLTDLDAAVRHYWQTRRDDFELLVIELAGKDVRAGKRSIPGFEVKEEARAL